MWTQYRMYYQDVKALNQCGKKALGSFKPPFFSQMEIVSAVGYICGYNNTCPVHVHTLWSVISNLSKIMSKPLFQLLCNMSMPNYGFSIRSFYV